jgi:hypothetical protein
MTYASTNKPFLIVPAVAGGAQGAAKGGNLYAYRSTDTVATVTGTTSYFGDGALEGMQVSDGVIVFDTVTPGVTLCSVNAVVAGAGANVVASDALIGGVAPGNVISRNVSTGSVASSSQAVLGADPRLSGLLSSVVNSAYTFGSSDAGFEITHTDTGAYSWTVPLYASAPFTASQRIGILNYSAAALTILSSNVSLTRLDGTAGSSNRTIGANSVAMLNFISTNVWGISGTALS